MFEFIEKVVYINLEHRLDRKEETEAELYKYFSKDKVVRFNAVQESRGCIGCSKSHIGALELAKVNGWKNVLIVEDDASWDSRFDTEYPILEKLASASYDVICLGALGHSDARTYKLLHGQTRTAYLVSQHYYDVLINNKKEGLEFLSTPPFTKEKYATYGGDQYWKRLQKKDNWFRVRLMYQRKSYSDIARAVVDYSSWFLKH